MRKLTSQTSLAGVFDCVKIAASITVYGDLNFNLI